ncbi:MAG: hypothetical protein ACE37F_26095 [Nannocystaceae bacterium]|nr:recombinase family protein [bacterium]
MRRTDQQRQAISRGTRAALARRRREGLRTGAYAFGTRQHTHDPAMVEPDPHEARALRRMAELHECGFGPKAIAEQLTREGHCPRGARWWPETICRLLKRGLSSDA